MTIPGPQSEHDWTIHSINIHGVFFERWCQQIIAKSKDWKIKSTNYPVNFKEKESTLDIRAESHEGDRITTLLIECKKNNPDFVNWVFFPKTHFSGGSSMSVQQITCSPLPQRTRPRITICELCRDAAGTFKAPNGETVEVPREHRTQIDEKTLPETFRTAEWVDFIEDIMHGFGPPTHDPQ